MIHKLFLKFFAKFIQVKTNIKPGDLVSHLDNDYPYEAMGIFFNENLSPVLFVQDPADGKIFGVPIHEYKRLSKVK